MENLNLKGDKAEEAKEIVGEIIVEEINNFLDNSKSPVKGGQYKPLKKDGTASLLFDSGDMRSQIKFKPHRQGVRVGIFSDAPKLERLKSSGHNLGDSRSGVKREFIPDDNNDGVFKKTIIAKANKALRDFKESQGEEDDADTDGDLGSDSFGNLFSDDFLNSLISNVSGATTSTIAGTSTISSATAFDVFTEFSFSVGSNEES